jgi:hypothetical protein
MNEPVRLTTLHDEQEAEIVCGLLRSAGIECGHRPTEERIRCSKDFSQEDRTRSSFTSPIWKPPRRFWQTRRADRYRTARSRRRVGGRDDAGELATANVADKPLGCRN